MIYKLLSFNHMHHLFLYRKFNLKVFKYMYHRFQGPTPVGLFNSPLTLPGFHSYSAPGFAFVFFFFSEI